MEQLASRISNELSTITAHINAGGLGTRLHATVPKEQVHPVRGVSKALLEVGTVETKLIDHHIMTMLNIGCHAVVAAVGNHTHVAEYVHEKFAEQPRVCASSTATQKGTGGDLLTALTSHPDQYQETVLVTNVDTILDIDYAKLVSAHRQADAAMTIALSRNRGVPNQDAFYVNDYGAIIFSAEAESNVVTPEQAEQQSVWRGSSTGAVMIERSFLQDIDWRPEHGSLSVYRNMVGDALGRGALCAYDNGNNFFIDVGTHETLNQVRANPELIQLYLQQTKGEVVEHV